MHALRKWLGTHPRRLGTLVIGMWLGTWALAAVACGDDGKPGAGSGGSADGAGAGGETSGAAASGATSPGGEASGGGGSVSTPQGGDDGGGSGGSAQAGTTPGGSNSGGSAAGSGGSGNALCTQVDGNGFFATCDACGPDCDTISTDAGSRKACGCGAGCPCGLSCGCYEIGPNISVCDICVR